jgi:uncharacterized protein (TIGR03066 family)
MRAILGAALAAVLVATAGASADDKSDKIDPKLLVGKWEPKEARKDQGIVMEFTKDNKLYLTVEVGGKTEKLAGTYAVKGNKMTVQMKFGEKDVKEEVTILKLTEEELQTEDSKGKKETMRRSKAK